MWWVTFFLIAMIFNTTDKDIRVYPLNLSVYSAGSSLCVCVLLWFGTRPPHRRAERGGADPPPSNFPGGSTASVSPRRDGDVRRAAACSLGDSEGNQQWPVQQLKGNARCGDAVLDPQWAADLGTWAQPGSSLWASASARRLSEDHRCCWTLRYSCNKNYYKLG